MSEMAIFQQFFMACSSVATPRPLLKLQASEPEKSDLILRRRIPQSRIVAHTSPNLCKVRGSALRSMESLPFAPIPLSLLLALDVAVPAVRNERHLQWQTSYQRLLT